MSLVGYNPATVSTFASGTYRHVAFSISGTTHTLYLDGSAVAINTNAGNVFASYTSAINNLYIGCAGDLSYGYTGIIDDFKIFNRALPARDISAIYLANYVPPVSLIIPFTPNMIVGMTLWLDAADATTFTLSGTQVSTWADKSSFGNNAVATTNITSSTAFTTGPTSLITKSTFTMNSIPYPTVYFSPTSQNGAALRIANISLNTFPMTMFFVFNYAGTSSSLYNFLCSRFPFNAIDPVISDHGLFQINQPLNNNMVTLGIKGSGGNAYINTNTITTTSLFMLTVQYTLSDFVLNINGSRSVSTAAYTVLPTASSTILGDGMLSTNGMYVCERIF
jgi:hypothetical protein